MMTKRKQVLLQDVKADRHDGIGAVGSPRASVALSELQREGLAVDAQVPACDAEERAKPWGKTLLTEQRAELGSSCQPARKMTDPDGPGLPTP